VIVPDPPSTAPVPPDPPEPIAITLHAAATKTRLPARAALRGRATAADGSPQAGVQLTFERRAFGGDEDDWTPAGTTTTAGDGSFRFPVVRRSGQIRVQPSSPSVAGRALVVGFVAPVGLSLRSSGHTLSNGDRLTLRGRVRRDGGAYQGRDVLVQAIVRGAWRTVDTAEVGDGGRVTWTYRFAHTQRTADYRFRLCLPTARALPWKAVTSRPVDVLVRGG
jgi:hypothetical protein